VAVALAVAVLAGCAGDDGEPVSSAPEREPGRQAQTSLHDLHVGDCVQGLGSDRDVSVRVVRCRRPHRAEVYALFDLGGDQFPGVEVLRRRAATGCLQQFAPYSGEPAGPGTELAFVEVVPTLQSWAAGDRRALCLALGPNGTNLSGSIAGRSA
jgi:hypothetical protein